MTLNLLINLNLNLNKFDMKSKEKLDSGERQDREE